MSGMWKREVSARGRLGHRVGLNEQLLIHFGGWRGRNCPALRAPVRRGAKIVAAGGAETMAPGATGGIMRTCADQRKCGEQDDERRDTPSRYQEALGTDVGGQVGVDNQF